MLAHLKRENFCFFNWPKDLQDQFGGGATWSQDQEEKCGKQGKHLFANCCFIIILSIFIIFIIIILFNFANYFPFFILSFSSGEQVDGWNRASIKNHCNVGRWPSTGLENVKQMKCKKTLTNKSTNAQRI